MKVKHTLYNNPATPAGAAKTWRGQVGHHFTTAFYNSEYEYTTTLVGTQAGTVASGCTTISFCVASSADYALPC